MVDNGFGLFGERSMAFKKIFGSAPSGIVDTRPESDKNFLQFLGGKEVVMYRLASRDVSDRSLAAGTQDAVDIMGSPDGRAQRRVCAEVLHRSL